MTPNSPARLREGEGLAFGFGAVCTLTIQFEAARTKISQLRIDRKPRWRLPVAESLASEDHGGWAGAGGFDD